jgi:hypothetical protein
MNDKKNNINVADFTILTPLNFNKLDDRNYRVNQLKTMCRLYKLSVSGNKQILVNRLRCFLKLSYNVIFIQTIWKKKMHKKYIKSRGPAYINRSVCVNDCDFYTSQSMNKISNVQFISYKCNDGKIYGFDIMSIHTLITHTQRGKKSLNPYNRSELPDVFIENLRYIQKFAVLYGEEVVLQQEEDNVDETKKIQLRCLSLFQHIQEVSSYIVDHSWLLELNRTSILRFIRELCDIWVYRAQLENHIKRSICPPNGDAFTRSDIRDIVIMNIEQLQSVSLNIIERLITHANTSEFQILGANYVICALTLVNTRVAEQFPWLYQSVAYNQLL